MAEEKTENLTHQELIKKLDFEISQKLKELAQAIDGRFERMKKIVIDYLNLGSDFAKGSLITALKQV